MQEVTDIGGKTRNQNEIVVTGRVARMRVTNKRRGFAGEAVFSASDLPLIRPHYWTARWEPKAKTYYAACGALRPGGMYMHRWVLGMGDTSGLVVDHKNHNTLDNRRRNLRRTTGSQNQQNRRGANSNSASGVRGVLPVKRGGWQAYVSVGGKKYQTYHRTFEEAATAVKEMRQRLMTHSVEPDGPAITPAVIVEGQHIH